MEAEISSQSSWKSLSALNFRRSLYFFEQTCRKLKAKSYVATSSALMSKPLLSQASVTNGSRLKIQKPFFPSSPQMSTLFNQGVRSSVTVFCHHFMEEALRVWRSAVLSCHKAHAITVQFLPLPLALTGRVRQNQTKN